MAAVRALALKAVGQARKNHGHIGGFGGGYSVDDLEIRSNGAEYTIKGTVRDGNGREIARKEYVLDAYDGGYTIRAIRPCAD